MSVSDYYYACTKCGNSKSTFYYISERDFNPMVLTDLFIYDDSLFYGDVEMNFAITINVTNGNTLLAEDDAPRRFLEAYAVNAASQAYCAEARVSSCVDSVGGCLNAIKTCATTTAGAYANMWVPTVPFTRYSFRVVATPARGVWCESGTPDCLSCAAAEPLGNKNYCPCMTGMCFARYAGNGVQGHSRVYRAGVGSGSAESFLFWEFYDTLAPSTVIQSGVIDLLVSTANASGTTMPISGTMYVRPQNTVLGGGTLNWYKAAPFRFDGTYSTASQVLSFTSVKTRAELAAKLKLSVRCNYCSVELPLRGIAYSTGSTAGAKILYGNIRQLNMALRRIAYTPAWLSGYNTQAVSVPSRQITSEEILLVFDKSEVNAAQNVPPSIGIKNVTAVVLPVTIVAVNQPATVTSQHQVGQAGYNQFTTLENTAKAIYNTAVLDPDLDEVLLTQFPPLWKANSAWISMYGASALPLMPATTCPAADAKQITRKARMTLSVRHGSIMFNWTSHLVYREIVVRDVGGTDRNITMPPDELVQRIATQGGDVKCGLDNLPLCTAVANSLFTPVQPNDRVVWKGARKLIVEGTQACFNALLKEVTYRTDEDYNNNVPESGSPVDILGCPQDPNSVPSSEALNVSIDDLGYVGCTTAGSVIGSGSVPISVLSVTSPLAIKAPGGLVVHEDSILAFTDYGCPPSKFRSCGALQVAVTPFYPSAFVPRSFLSSDVRCL